MKRQYLGNGKSYHKNAFMTFAEVNIRSRMAPLQILYSVTLTFFFMVKHFLLCICYEKCTGSGCPRQICLNSHGPAVEFSCLRVRGFCCGTKFFSLCRRKESPGLVQSASNNPLVKIHFTTIGQIIFK